MISNRFSLGKSGSFEEIDCDDVEWREISFTSDDHYSICDALARSCDQETSADFLGNRSKTHR